MIFTDMKRYKYPREITFGKTKKYKMTFPAQTSTGTRSTGDTEEDGLIV